MPRRPRLASIALAFALPGAPATAQELPPCPDGGTALRWETFVAPLFATACNECHEWSYADAYRDRAAIVEQVAGGDMPPFEPLPDADVDRLLEWFACGAPIEGPACPPTGTAVAYEGFVRQFLDTQCGACHTSGLQGDERQGAPEDQNFDDPASLRAHATGIRASLLRQDMPPSGPAPQPDAGKVLEWLACGLPGLPDPPPFRRGDANQDGALDVSDAVQILGFLFGGTAVLACLDAADIDASGVLDVSDAVLWLNFLFLGGRTPPPPFDACGSAEKLGCGSAAGC